MARRMASIQNLNANTKKQTATQKVANHQGMKEIYTAQAAADGKKSRYSSPAYKANVSGLAEGDKSASRYIDRTLKSGDKAKTTAKYQSVPESKKAQTPTLKSAKNINRENAIKATIGKSAAVSRIAKDSGMKRSAVKQAAEIGSRLNYSNPAYKQTISAIAEGDKAREKKYTKQLQNARPSAKASSGANATPAKKEAPKATPKATPAKAATPTKTTTTAKASTPAKKEEPKKTTTKKK